MTDSIPARLRAQAAAHPDAPAYWTRGADRWEPTSYHDYFAQVRAVSRSLLALGLGEGGIVCILGFNRPEWTLADIGAMCAGGAAAGIYTTCPAGDVEYILDNSQAPIIVIEDAGQLAKVRAGRTPHLRHIVAMRGFTAEGVLSWDEFLARGQTVDDAEVDRRIDNLQADALATLVYTSGTTGFPKGVMLSHRNLAWTAAAANAAVAVTRDDTTLSYLPLSHIAEQMFSIHIPITGGASIYFAQSLEKLPENLKEVQPTLFFGVPRVWEKFHAGISGKLAEAKGAKAHLVKWAQGVGRAASAYLNQGKPLPWTLKWQYDLANKVIFSKLRPAIGLGKVRVAVSGAAPISAELLEFFSGLDVRIHEVYGQSEDSGPTSFSLPGKNRYGTVGPPFPGVEVKIAEDGEIRVRGPNVFMGYYRDPDATAATKDGEWLLSGDVGELDADGFLRITGRKKEILITAGGKNIAPIRIESLLKNLELVAEAVAIADRRKFVAALVTLEEAALARFADMHGLTGDLLNHPKVHEALQAGIAQVNEKLSQVEHVRKFHVLPAPFSIEGGELTPSMKVKRRVVEKKYAEPIEAMYGEPG